MFDYDQVRTTPFDYIIPTIYSVQRDLWNNKQLQYPPFNIILDKYQMQWGEVVSVQAAS